MASLETVYVCYQSEWVGLQDNGVPLAVLNAVGVFMKLL